MRFQSWFNNLSRLLNFGLILALVVSLGACGPEISTTVQTSGPTVQQALTYQGPRARIAVASFKCKAAKCNGEIGSGLADMLSTALFQTGRFVVLERGEGLKAIQEELNLGQSGYVQQGKAPQIGLLEGADILVIGAITAFEPNASGIGGGGVIIPFNVPILGGAAIKKKEAYIAADIRLVDVRTGRVINATKVEGKASQWKVGGGAGLVLGTVALGGGLGAYKNTPMEKAIRVMLENAVKAIAQMVPENYYRYSATGQEVHPTSYNQQTPSASPAPTGGIVGGQLTSGGIIGGGERFVAGKKVLFQEDFSEYNIGDIPTGIHLMKGQVEVASFSGRKWLRALSKNVDVQAKLRLPQNFAVEWDVYFSKSVWGMAHAMFLGEPRDPNSPDVLHWASDWEYPRWSGKEIRTTKIRAGEIHHFAVQQKNGMIKIFVDGQRIYQEPIGGGIVGGNLPNRNAISFGLWGANPSEHKEILITNIRVTAY